jgi:hypothetical protein
MPGGFNPFAAPPNPNNYTHGYPQYNMMTPYYQQPPMQYGYPYGIGMGMGMGSHFGMNAYPQAMPMGQHVAASQQQLPVYYVQFQERR